MKSSVTVGSQTTSSPIPVDYMASNFNVGFGVVINGGGTLTYSIEHTFDNVFDPAITPTWFTHVSVSGETTNQDGNYTSPIRALRLNVTAWTSGSATLSVLQGVS